MDLNKLLLLRNKYAISNLKTFNGREGVGYSCTLLKGCKCIAECIDDARGGGINYIFP